MQQLVWGVEVTIGTRLSIEFGDEILMPEHRQSHGAWHLLLQDCHWRIEDTKSILVGSDDDDLVARVEGLRFGKVNDIQLLPPTNDLEIVFDDNLRLNTFLTHSTVSPGSMQWYLFCPNDVVWIAEGGGELVRKNRHES
jgi:hypothetical protein